VSNILQLLSKFLDRFEGKKTLKPEMKHSQYANLQPLTPTVILRPEMIKKTVQISLFQTVGHLRVKIAETFGGLPLNSFVLFLKNTLIDPDEDDDRYIREFGLIQQAVIAMNQAYNVNAHPKKLLAAHQENYDKLFGLLSSESSPGIVEQAWDLL
jgi:hypothetical protein